MMKNKKYAAGVFAAALGFGMMTLSPAVEAAPVYQSLDYINGATNEYSFRMKEEDRIHDENVRRIKFDFRRDGDQEKYNRAMREEQKRHDQAVKRIMRDYNNRKPWRH